MTPEEAHRSIATLATSTPKEWHDFLAISSAFFVLGRTELALLNARHALALTRNPLTLLNLAVILESQSEFFTALPLAAEAHSLDPTYPHAATLYSDSLLRMGRFAEAWPIYSHSHADWKFARNVWPEWDGTSSLKGKRILVLSGGGYGDNILFLRWMPRLKDMGAHVTYMCPKSMHEMLADWSSIDRLIAGSVAGLEGMLIPKDYDCFTCILSLGEHFCMTPDDIPTAPYIHKHKLPVPGRVGLRTIAGEEHFPRRHRTLTAEQASRLKAVLGDFVDLDSPRLTTWEQTAHALSFLELVVTVDTGVAHLAGAMGIPCWVTLPGFSASYYAIRGMFNPFYPSQRLFRNGGEGIDTSVDAACEALKERAHAM